MRPVLMLSVILWFLHPLVTAAETLHRDQLGALLSQCQQAREQKLAPLRAEQIEKCLARGRQQDYCERRYQEYGERIVRPSSENTVGLFWHLPECEKAIAAERYFGRNPSQEQFEYSPR